MTARALRWTGLLVITLVGSLAMLSFFSRRPEDLGVSDGRLAACPDKPNCVSTQAADERHAIEPIRFSGSAVVALDHLRYALRQQPRITIVHDQGLSKGGRSQDDGYIHAEARSRFFRFVDDLEFIVDEAEGLIHFRSASRTGHADLGVNRERAESIRTAFARAAAATSGSKE